MLNTSEFVFASWHADNVESGVLLFFNHEIEELVHYIKDEPSEQCKILPLTENLNHCSIYFSHKEETNICIFVIPKTTDTERIKQKLLRTAKECEKLLRAFDDVRFGK